MKIMKNFILLLTFASVTPLLAFSPILKFYNTTDETISFVFTHDPFFDLNAKGVAFTHILSGQSSKSVSFKSSEKQFLFFTTKGIVLNTSQEALIPFAHYEFDGKKNIIVEFRQEIVKDKKGNTLRDASGKPRKTYTYYFGPARAKTAGKFFLKLPKVRQVDCKFLGITGYETAVYKQDPYRVFLAMISKMHGMNPQQKQQLETYQNKVDEFIKKNNISFRYFLNKNLIVFNPQKQQGTIGFIDKTKPITLNPYDALAITPDKIGEIDFNDDNYWKGIYTTIDTSFDNVATKRTLYHFLVMIAESLGKKTLPEKDILFPAEPDILQQAGKQLLERLLPPEQ